MGCERSWGLRGLGEVMSDEVQDSGLTDTYYVNVYREAICESWYSAEQANRQASKNRIGLLKFTTHPDGSFEIERMELPK